MHKIEVKNKSGHEGQISKGMNTQIYIDGEPARGVKSFKYEVNAAGIGIATLEYYADVVVESNVPDIVANEILLADTEVPVVGEITTQLNKSQINKESDDERE